jgi:Ca2+-binding EF-hand superfamily protein
MPVDMAMAKRFFDEMDTDKSGTIRKCEVYQFLTKKQNKTHEEAIGILAVS